MLPKEIIKKVRRIEITTSRLVSDVFAGQYHSVFKGQGLEFDEVREYTYGDDIRRIDWNVTAKTGRPHVKKFIEERELTVMILIDTSASTRFGTTHALKSQIAAEISALLSFAAIRNNDKVGALIFTDKIEKFIAPFKGSSHVLRLVRELLYFKPTGSGTNMLQALEYLNRTMPRKVICFIISDFLSPLPTNHPDGNNALKKMLKTTNKHHDVIAITVNDPKERELPKCGIIALEDAENKRMIYVDSEEAYIREAYYKNNIKRISEREAMLASCGIDSIDIDTNHSYANEIVKFFLKRRRKR